MVCCSSPVRKILPVLLGISSNTESDAFLANPSWIKHPSNCHPSSSLLAKDSTVDVHAGDGSHSKHSSGDSSIGINRRALLSTLQAAPFLVYQSASAQVEAVDAPAPQINAAQKGTPRTLCADSEEENRIAVFQRVAPSVVYIDTFAEKRDVFSTNV